MDVALTGGPVEIVNALDLDRTPTGIAPRRLPAWTRPQIPDLFMEFMVTLGSGVRVALRTDAPWIELDVVPTGFEVRTMPAPTIAYDLVVDGTACRPSGRRFRPASRARPREVRRVDARR